MWSFVCDYVSCICTKQRISQHLLATHLSKDCIYLSFLSLSNISVHLLWHLTQISRNEIKGFMEIISLQWLCNRSARVIDRWLALCLSPPIFLVQQELVWMAGWMDEWHIKNVWTLRVVSISFYGNLTTSKWPRFDDSSPPSLLINAVKGWMNRWTNRLIEGGSKKMNGL